ncbi:DegV family protein, partial [Acinetobacter baumannii]|nr:DegV family protein [Acinetobacter baumannii]
EEGDDVVVITMSSALSGTYQSACIAAEGARGKGTGTVRVVDSLNMTLGERIVVQYALQLLDAGASAISSAVAP